MNLYYTLVIVLISQTLHLFKYIQMQRLILDTNITALKYVLLVIISLVVCVNELRNDDLSYGKMESI